MASSTASTQSNAQGLWAPKRTITLEVARSHSRRIRLLRWIMIILIILLVGVFARLFTRQNTSTLTVVSNNEAIKMTNPRYGGRTDDGMPYYLTAYEAVRLAGQDAQVSLNLPVLEFYRAQNMELSNISADAGIYDDANKILILQHKVVLKTDDGIHCETTHARIFAKTKKVEGDEPIFCTGKFGEIKGAAYEIGDNFSVFTFKDGVNAILEQGQ